MKHYPTIFRQLLDLIPRYKFDTFVNRYKGDFKSHKLSCWNQFTAILYGQIRHLDTIRGIETGLETHRNKLYHLGSSPIKRSTFSDANNKRNYHIYESLFYELLAKCQKLAQGTFKFNNPIKSMDATVINLCHSLFPWAKYRTAKGAIKLHVLFANESYLPDAIILTDGNVNDGKVAKAFTIRSDSIYVFDRAYHDFKWYADINARGAKFVARAKSDMSYSVIGQHNIDPESDVISDEDIIVPWRHKPQESLKPKYPDPLRLVTFKCPETGMIYRFITNIIDFESETIALIYKQRWQIELFFKWIKQNLKIKSFIGTSKNAVFTQIWIAMIAYLLIWYIKHQSRFRYSLLKLTRIINEALFEKISFFDVLGLKSPSLLKKTCQLALDFP
ncbi:MAG: IS4 family transposase [bacterium]|nr:IS4 family transposase [bacterium]